MKKLVLTVLLVTGVSTIHAVTINDDSDTLKMQELHEVKVQGVRLQKRCSICRCKYPQQGDSRLCNDNKGVTLSVCEDTWCYRME